MHSHVYLERQEAIEPEALRGRLPTRKIVGYMIPLSHSQCVVHGGVKHSSSG